MAESAVSELRASTSRTRSDRRSGSGVEVPRRWLGLGRASGALVAALISLGGAAWALHLWRADLGVPLRYGPIDDTKFYLMLVKGIIDHGWFEVNSSLGVPFGQQLYDFPQSADNLNLLLIRLLSVGSSNPAVVANLFFLSTFALAAACAYAVVRALGVSGPPALVGSVLFSLLSYHFFRGESHLLLSAYYAVPLSCYLFLGLLDERPLFARRATRGRRALAWVSRRTFITVALCLVIGSESLYYATFAEVLLIAATLFAVILRRPRANVVAGGLVCALIAATLAANLAPSVVYRMQHGNNPAVERSAANDEAHGLKLTNLVVPPPGDRIGALRRISATYDGAVAPTYCEACYAALGLVGTAGLGWLVLCGIGSLIGAATWFGARRVFRHSSVAVAIALAVATAGGLSSLIEFFITPDIRGWNRISVFIAFFALLAVAVLLDAMVRTARGRGGVYRCWPAVLLAVGALGVYEQTTDDFIPTYAADAAEYRSDATLVADIQGRLAHGSAVFALPYVPFPEGYSLDAGAQPATSFDLSYELARGYIHSSTLRWSYGAMKGRAQDWPAQLAAQPLTVVLPAVAAAGFRGVWVDPHGYPSDAAQVRTALTQMVGQPPITGPAADVWFFDLRDYAARLARARGPQAMAALRHAALWPLRATCARNALVLENPSRRARSATLQMSLAPSGAGPARVGARLHFPDGGEAAFLVGPKGVTVTRHLSVAPGSSRVSVAVPGPAVGLQASVFRLTDDAMAPAASRPPGRIDPTAGVLAPPCTWG